VAPDDDDEDDLESVETTAEARHGPSLRRLLLLVVAPALVFALVLALGVWTLIEIGGDDGPVAGRERAARASVRRRGREVPDAIELTTVRCAVGRALDGWDGIRVEQLVQRGDERELVGLRIRREGDDLVFTHKDPEGVAALHWGQHRARGRAMFSWETDHSGVHCTFKEALPLPKNRPVRGRVLGADALPEGEVSLEGCGTTPADTVDAAGSFYLLMTAEGCRLRAWRTHGSLRVPGPWVAVNPRAVFEELEVELTVPTWEPAGMGIQIRPDGDGMRVTRVLDGSPAEVAGVMAGDLVLSIDGVATEGMDLDTFLQYGLGPDGSEVELEVETPDGEVDLIAVRRALIE
jgi:hypothetical protein